MTQTATITKFNFLPMIELVPSILQYWIKFTNDGVEYMIEDKGSIESLSIRYKFKVVSDKEWDFTGFVGRRCLIQTSDVGFKFGGFL